jgi:HK97 family phage portal protein
MPFDAFDCVSAIQRPIRAAQDEPHAPGPSDDYWYVPVSGISSGRLLVSGETALSIATVFSCIRVLSEGVASLPLNMYERLPGNKGKEVAYKHPLFRLLKYQPNERHTAIQFWETAMAHLLLRGRFLAEIRPGSNGPFGQLLPLNPDRVSVVTLNNGKFRYDYRDELGGERRFLEDELFRVEGLSLDGKQPVSILKYAQATMGLALSAQDYGARFFNNNARPGGVLQHPGKLNDPARENLKSSWQKAYGGSSNAGKVAILEEGMTFQAMSLTMEDAQFLDTRKFQRDEVCAIFRVQPHKVMNLERSTNNNIEHQGIEHVQDTLLPWFVRIEQAIARDLILDNERYFAEFLADAILRGDANTRGLFYRNAILTGWMTRNEARAKENMNPIEGADELLTPMNMAAGADPAKDYGLGPDKKQSPKDSGEAA